MAAGTKQGKDDVPELGDAMEDAFASGMAELEAAGSLEPMDAGDTPAEPAKGTEPAAEQAKATDEPKAEQKSDVKGEAKAEPGAKGADPKAEIPPVDPYEGTTPLTLTVDGKPVTIPDILLADGGGLIPPDKLQAVQDRFVRGMQAEQQVQQLTEQSRQTQHVLSQLSHTVEGETYQGLAAFEAMKAESLAMLEGTKAILSHLNDSNFVHNLAFANQTGDVEAAKALIKQAIDASSGAYRVSAVTGLRAADRLQIAGPPAPPMEPASGLEKAVDYLFTFKAPDGTQPFAGLNADDRAAAMRHFGPFAGAVIRQATAEEAAKLGLKAGDPVAEYGKILPWLEDRLAWRKGEAERATKQTEQIKATEDATKFNARITRNRQPAKTETKAPTKLPPRAEDGTFKKSKHESIHDIFEQGMAELNLAG